jgi:hypothetical protein
LASSHSLELAAVALDPRLVLVGECAEALGVRLRGVVLPQLHVGVGPPGEIGQFAQGGAVGQRGQHGAGGEVGADAHHVRRVDTALGERAAHRSDQRLDIVGGQLQGPVGWQAFARGGGFADHAVAVLADAAPSTAPSAGRATTAARGCKSTPIATALLVNHHGSPVQRAALRSLTGMVA